MANQERKTPRRTFIFGAAAITVSALFAAKRGDVEGALAAFLPRPETQPETQNWKEDIWISAASYGIGEKIITLYRPGSNPRFPETLYMSSYNPNTKKFSWIRKEAFINYTMRALAVSPVDSQVWAIGGERKNNPSEGAIRMTRNDGQSFQEIQIPNLASVKSAVFSKNGDYLYLSTSSGERIVKINTATGTRVEIANNGLSLAGGPILASPNNNEVLYTLYPGNPPAVMRSTDGGENWSVLIDNTVGTLENDVFRVSGWQGQDVVTARGNFGLAIKVGDNNPVINSFSPDTLALDNTASELTIYGGTVAGSILYMIMKTLSEVNWRYFPSTDLPQNRHMRNLSLVTTTDNEKYLMGTVHDFNNESLSSGFWVYQFTPWDILPWRQNVEGLLGIQKSFMPITLKNATSLP